MKEQETATSCSELPPSQASHSFYLNTLHLLPTRNTWRPLEKEESGPTDLTKADVRRSLSPVSFWTPSPSELQANQIENTQDASPQIQQEKGGVGRGGRERMRRSRREGDFQRRGWERERDDVREREGNGVGGSGVRKVCLTQSQCLCGCMLTGDCCFSRVCSSLREKRWKLLLYTTVTPPHLHTVR